jgi:hypothetical protein
MRGESHGASIVNFWVVSDDGLKFRHGNSSKGNLGTVQGRTGRPLDESSTTAGMLMLGIIIITLLEILVAPNGLQRHASPAPDMEGRVALGCTPCWY